MYVCMYMDDLFLNFWAPNIRNKYACLCMYVCMYVVDDLFCSSRRYLYVCMYVCTIDGSSVSVSQQLLGHMGATHIHSHSPPPSSSSLLAQWLQKNRPCFALAELLRVPVSSTYIHTDRETDIHTYRHTHTFYCYYCLISFLHCTIIVGSPWVTPPLGAG